MTSMISSKGNVITAMAIRAAASLCIVAMIAGCSSGVVAKNSEDTKDDQSCLTDEQKLAKLKELDKKDSWFKNFAEDTVIRGGGNFLGSMVGLGDAGEYADNANAIKKMTVKGNVARDSIDTVFTKDCGPEPKAPGTTPSKADGTAAVIQ